MLQLHNQPSSGLWFSEGCAHITGIILGDTHLILGCNQITNHMKLFFLAAIKDGYEMTVSCQIRFQASTWATPSIASTVCRCCPWTHHFGFWPFRSFPPPPVCDEASIQDFHFWSIRRYQTLNAWDLPGDQTGGVTLEFFSGWEGFRFSDAHMNFMVSPDLESEIPPKKYEISWEQSQFEGIPNLEEHRNHLSCKHVRSARWVALHLPFSSFLILSHPFSSFLILPHPFSSFLILSPEAPDLWRNWIFSCAFLLVLSCKNIWLKMKYSKDQGARAGQPWNIHFVAAKCWCVFWADRDPSNPGL